jgi:hypothetical protein
VHLARTQLRQFFLVFLAVASVVAKLMLVAVFTFTPSGSMPPPPPPAVEAGEGEAILEALYDHAARDHQGAKLIGFSKGSLSPCCCPADVSRSTRCSGWP